MSQTIKIKRSAVAGKAPAVTDLELGELAVNTFDGKLYTKINDGFDAVVQLSADKEVPYTAGQGIEIDGRVISSTVKSAGTVIEVQFGDGQGNFGSVPQQPAGRVLTSNGDQPPTWEPVPVSGGTVREIDVSGGATGLTFTGGPVTEEGVITMSGTLGIGNGGTGATTVAGAQAALLPSQVGKVGSALYTDGNGTLSWAVPPGEAYTAGTGLQLTGNQFASTVADSSGQSNRVTVSKGDGTLKNLPAGTAGYVLTSAGANADPTWENVGGTVSSVKIVTDPTMGLYIAGGDATDPPTPNTKEITTTGTIALSGKLALANGGTGGTSAVEARTNILPSQTGHTEVEFLSTNGADVAWTKPLPTQTGNIGKFLTTDGNVASWQNPPGSGTVTSVALSGGTTGLTTSGGPVTTTGTITLGGTLAVANGGTGVTSAADLQKVALPDQTNNNGRVLVTNGTNASWSATVGQGTVTSVAFSGGTTGLTSTGGPVTTDGTLTLAGKLVVANGGTGGSTAQEARTNLMPTQAGKAGAVLTTDGTDVSWSTTTGTGTVTSVAVDGGTTGLTTSGGPVTSSGTITLGGTLAIANGGTGGTTAEEAQNNILPTQATNAGKILGTDGTNVAWVSTAAGSVTSVAVDGGTTGLTTSGGPITSNGTITLGGTLAIANGGTGSTTATGALANILPAQATNAGKVLTSNGATASWANPLPDQTNKAGAVLVTNGTTASWSTTTGTGTVTSVTVDGGTTGLTTSGGPVTSNGTITLGGTLAIANGGTGKTTAADAINALVPAQTGQTGKYLMTNGTIVGWSNAGQGSVTSVAVDGGTTGLTTSGGPVTSNGTITLGGKLALANGGTGGTSAQEARNNILPVQSTHAGQVLVTDGTNVSWSDTIGQGTVTSVAMSGGTTGLTTSGGPVTSNGTITLGGTLAIANGGTGSTTAAGAINALVPAQTSNTGKFLTTNGTAVSWGSAVAGTNTQVMYNNNGTLAGATGFTFDSTTTTLAVPSLTTTTTVDLSGSVFSSAVVVAASAVDCSKGVYFTKTVSAALTWTFTSVPATGKSYICALALTNGGAYAQTWPSTVVWPGGSAPTLTTGATAVDLLIFSTSDGGATWRGSSILNYAK